jgi:DNA polymerase
MEPFGDGKLKILNLGEAPGEIEDRRGKQWQGKMGQALQKSYEKLGIDLFGDCVNINSANCRPTTKDGNNRAPTNDEIASCRSRVLQVIEQHKPHVIMLFGGSAVTSLIGHRWKKDLGGIFRWRGWTIPDRDFNAWLCPVFHPSFVERSEEEVGTVWMQDLEHALSYVDKPLPKWTDERKQVEIIEDLSVLETLDGPVAFDYETSGLKSHDTSRHRIVSMSVSNRADHAYAFMFPQDKKNLSRVKRFLVGGTGKIAQNMKFEHAWSYNMLGVEVKNWVFDTMLASHVLDNRPDICGLKLQVFLNFGVTDYDSEIAPYLSSVDKQNGNAVNRIDELVKTEAGKRKLLIYNGMDSLFEFRLAQLQMKRIGI